MAPLFDEIAAAVPALELSANTFRLLASDERARLLDALAHWYVQEPTRRCWWVVFGCRSFLVAFVGEAGRHRRSRLVYQLLWQRPSQPERIPH